MQAAVCETEFSRCTSWTQPTSPYNGIQTPEMQATGVTWQPFLPYCNAIQIQEFPLWPAITAKRFMLYKSLFDLINSFQYLDLNDKRLRAWYLALSGEDRQIIQEEGGFLSFILKHPALEVARQIGVVHLKPQIRRAALEMASDLNKSRMPTIYGTSKCKSCGVSNPSDSDKCRACIIQAPMCSQVTAGKNNEPALKQNSERPEQNLSNKPNRGVWVDFPRGVPHGTAMQDSFQSAFDKSHTSLASFEPSVSDSQRLSKEWRADRTGIWSPSSSVLRDTSAQASFSLDMELERQASSKKAQGSLPLGQPACLQTEFSVVTDNRSYADLAQETPPEYYSFNSTRFEQTSEWDAGGGQSSEQTCAESAQVTRGSKRSAEVCSPGLFTIESPTTSQASPSMWNSFPNPAEKGSQHKSVKSKSLNCTRPQESQQTPLLQTPLTALPVKFGSSKQQLAVQEEDPSMDDSSFLSIIPDESEVKLPEFTPAYPTTSSQHVDACGDFRASFMSSQECQFAPSTTHASTEMEMPKCLEQGCQTMPAVVTQGSQTTQVVTGQGTQTTQVVTAQKSIITEVQIADLDFLTKEFLRLKSVEQELEMLKDSQLMCGCACGERLKRAELKLLALQYAMCQDHCWRRYYSNAQGEKELHRLDGLPEMLAETLRTLEKDYTLMRRQVISGVALDDLSPLSVNTHCLNTETRFTPAQKITECQEDEFSFESPDDPNQPLNSTRRKGNSLVMDPDKSCKDMKSKNTAHKPVGGSAMQNGSITQLKLVPKSDPSLQLSLRPGSKEAGNVNSEAWYDAEEDFKSFVEEDPAVACLKPKDTGMGNGDFENSSRSQLTITGLHDDVTEKDLMLLFDNYQPREVSFTGSKESRTASMTVSCTTTSLEAVRNLSGTCLRGRPIFVRIGLCTPVTEESEENHAFKTSKGPSAPRPVGFEPEPGEEKRKEHDNKEKTVHSRLPQSLPSRLEKLVNISSVPTAFGTYVPPPPPSARTASTGSFDTLMARLSELHPHVPRQDLVEALLELRTQRNGTLSGLPLRSIVQMTSDLLTLHASAEK